MKNTFVCAIVALMTMLISSDIFAQRNNNNYQRTEGNTTLISTRPISLLVGQPNLKIEHGFSDNVSLGSHLSYFTGLNNGLKADPFVRFYPGSSDASPTGFYFQVKGSVGRHNKQLDVVRGDLLEQYADDIAPDDLDAYVDDLIAQEGEKRNFTAAGGGLAAGYQWMLGKNDNFVIDLYGGYKKYKAVSYDHLGTGEKALFNTTRNIPVEIGFQIGISF